LPVPPVPPLRIGGDLQRDALALALALGCTGEALAGYCDATRSAVSRWMNGSRDMPAAALACVVALLPWLLVHAEFQVAATRDSTRALALVPLARSVDRIVRAALADARLAANVEHAWSDVYAALVSAPGRAALANITAVHLLGRPAGSA
jgi:transcriptional regulator with XRE-family HTH domain